MAALITVEGVVTKTNPTGVQLDGADWRSISKFAEPQPAMPSTGKRVRLGLDGKGFVRTIEPLSQIVDTPAVAPAPTPTVGQNRETASTRLAVLKVAATFAASRPEMKSTDLLTLAERLEAWVTR